MTECRWERIEDMFIDSCIFTDAVAEFAATNGFEECEGDRCEIFSNELEDVEGKMLCSDCAEAERHRLKVERGEIIEVAPGQLTVEDFEEEQDASCGS